MNSIKEFLLAFLVVAIILALVGVVLLVFIYLFVDSYCIGYRRDSFPCTIGWLK